jgi:hypothetical protein
MPESSGIALSNLLKASRPPAEAPTPTTGNKFSDKIFGFVESDILIGFYDRIVLGRVRS